MLVNKGHWFLFTVDTVLQCPASVDLNSHWGEAHHPSSPHEFFKVFLLSSDYWPSVDRPSTECWPITDRYISEASTNYPWSVGEVSVNEKLYRPRHIWNDYWPCLDRVLFDYRPSLDRLLTAILTESRLTIDRVLTAIWTDRSVDTTYSKQDPLSHTHCRYNTVKPHYFELG